MEAFEDNSSSNGQTVNNNVSPTANTEINEVVVLNDKWPTYPR